MMYLKNGRLIWKVLHNTEKWVRMYFKKTTFATSSKSVSISRQNKSNGDEQMLKKKKRKKKSNTINPTYLQYNSIYMKF